MISMVCYSTKISRVTRKFRKIKGSPDELSSIKSLIIQSFEDAVDRFIGNAICRDHDDDSIEISLGLGQMHAKKIEEV